MTAAQAYWNSCCEFQLLLSDQAKPRSHSFPTGRLASTLLTTLDFPKLHLHVPVKPVDTSTNQTPSASPRMWHGPPAAGETKSHPPSPTLSARASSHINTLARLWRVIAGRAAATEREASKISVLWSSYSMWLKPDRKKKCDERERENQRAWDENKRNRFVWSGGGLKGNYYC